MSLPSAFLGRNWRRLELDRFGAPGRLTYVAATPRFRASAHVVFFIFADHSVDPVLVIKAARLPGAAPSLEREAKNLRAVQRARAGGFDSIPRLIAHEEFAGTHLLLESALPGRAMGPAFVRRRPEACAEALVRWVTELHADTAQGRSTRAAFDRLLARPLSEFERRFPLTAAENELIARTRCMTRPLRDASFPLVFQHGDLSAPNLLVSSSGRAGVVDWESAESASLPAADLFFSLAYVAFARCRARTIEEHIAAFNAAFYGPGAWARPHVDRYARSLGLPPQLLEPLFVACWSRYVIGLARRVDGPGSQPGLEKGTADWLRQNRYFALWRHAVRHADALTPAGESSRIGAAAEPLATRG